MKTEIKNSLDEIFTRHEASKRNAEQQQKKKQSEDAEFLKSFLDVQESVIRPAMLAIAQYLKARGYDCEITTERDGFHATEQRPIEASIKLKMFTDERRHSRHDTPCFSVTCEKNAKRVRFHESTLSPGRGGKAGTSGHAALSEVTEELIQQKVLKIIEEVFR